MYLVKNNSELHNKLPVCQLYYRIRIIHTLNEINVFIGEKRKNVYRKIISKLFSLTPKTES